VVNDSGLLNGIGALMSGAGAITTAVVATRIAWHRARTECEKRIEGMRKAFDLGLELERRDPQA
jgi:hypothetical protein